MEQPNTPLERQLISIFASNREDAYGTQRKRGWHLTSAARDLVARFGLQKWDNLKTKHVAYLVDRYKAEDTGRRSIEEKLSHLRWLVQKIGKANLLPRTNAELGVKPGARHTRAGKIPRRQVPEDPGRGDGASPPCGDPPRPIPWLSLPRGDAVPSVAGLGR